MSIKEVVIDTNFFMVPFQFNVDIITELEKVLPSYKLTTPSFVINELKGLKRNNKGKVRLNANLALKLANSSKVEIKDISLLENEIHKSMIIVNNRNHETIFFIIIKI